MIYLKPLGDTFIIYEEGSILPSPIPEDFIEIESLPVGGGILKMNDEGELYWFIPESEALEVVAPVLTPEQIQAEILMNTELLVMYKELGL